MNAESKATDRVFETIYVYGAGGHARVVAAACRLRGYRIGGFIEDGSSRIGTAFCRSRILARIDLPERAAVIIAFGNCRRRYELGNELQVAGFALPAIIHPAACVAEDTVIGAGCFIGALANIDPGCRIGDFCIVNNSAIVCHDSELDSGCHICPGTAIAGGVHIGARAWIGLGSRVIEGKSIGADALIGAGSVVVSSLPECSLAYGVPARVIKKME